VLTLDYGTHSKECYYAPLGFPRLPTLVGAAAVDDTPTYCGGTSFRIEADTTGKCDDGTTAPEIVCDGGSDDAPSSDIPPPACFNRFSNTCEPCCPTTEPECTGKPNGYPGYRCTVENNSYCSCACASGAWNCGC